jgi:hypothetical protein
MIYILEQKHTIVMVYIYMLEGNHVSTFFHPGSIIRQTLLVWVGRLLNEVKINICNNHKKQSTW